MTLIHFVSSAQLSVPVERSTMIVVQLAQTHVRPKQLSVQNSVCKAASVLQTKCSTGTSVLLVRIVLVCLRLF